jgi:hypothetical protein
MTLWRPQPGPQALAIHADFVNILLFGGARGGGKSDFLLGDFLQDVHKYQHHWQGIIFRRTLPELEEIIRRAKSIIGADAVWREQKKLFEWRNGARLRFRSCETERDADGYQGHQYSWMGYDEVGNQKDALVLDKLFVCNRWADAEIPTKRFRLTANPGGPGHHWVHERFISPYPEGFRMFNDAQGNSIMFIPSRVEDNQALMENDPNYLNRLASLGSEELVKAWRYGDWNVILGAFFKEFSQKKHVVKSFDIPHYWTRMRAVDWGYGHHTCVLWGAMSDGSVPLIPEDALVVYKEYYEKGRTPRETASEIYRLSKGERYAVTVMDPSAYSQQDIRRVRGPTIGDEFQGEGVTCHPADNDRRAGWLQVRHRLKHDKLFIFENCVNLIKYLPLLQYDKYDKEDAQKADNDDAPDTLRYLCMTRPYKSRAPEEENKNPMSVINLLKQQGVKLHDFERARR